MRKPIRKKNGKRTRKFVRSGRFYVYIMECADGTYYTGYTKDLKRRLKEHNSGKSGGALYTKFRRPVKLAWKKKFRLFIEAYRTESAIKRLTRKQKELLVVRRSPLAFVLEETGRNGKKTKRY